MDIAQLLQLHTQDLEWIELDDILEDLWEKRILDRGTHADDIKNKGSFKEKVSYLQETLSPKGEYGVHAFIESLREKGHRSLAARMTIARGDRPTSPRGFVQAKWDFLLDHLRDDKLAMPLLEAGILSLEDLDDIRTPLKELERNRILLMKLPGRVNKNNFEDFLRVLDIAGLDTVSKELQTQWEASTGVPEKAPGSNGAKPTSFPPAACLPESRPAAPVLEGIRLVRPSSRCLVELEVLVGIKMQTWHLAFLIACNEMLSEGSKEEIRLRKALFTDYPMVRPIDDPNLPLVVGVRLGLFQIIELDERNQALSTRVEVIERWNDTYINWNPEEFGGIRQIIVPINNIWIPDIILYNSVSTNYRERQLRTNAIVSHKGEVTLLTAAVFCSFCNVDVKYFPFDVQTCKMRFMTLTYDHTQIRLQTDHDPSIDLLSYAENDEFRLTSYKAEERIDPDPCCDEDFSVVLYSIRIQRRPGFFFLNYILPMMIINVMGSSLLCTTAIAMKLGELKTSLHVIPALLSFLMPCESGEKVTLGISAMLNMVIILMGLRDVLPPTENTPLIGKFYCACVFLVAVEVMLNIFTLYLYHLRGVRPLPQAMQTLCRVLARRHAYAMLIVLQSALIQAKGRTDGGEMHKMVSRRPSAKSATEESIRMEPVSEIDAKLSRLLSLLESREKREMERESKHGKAGEGEGGDGNELENWRTVSRILDRFFLNLFFFLNVGFSAGILLSSPGD
ncbi:unnamed protein product [Darwinula stevensoni]|uniref:Uncharacterized protein n=1 Tax=Darwinula stevensoni TaxID=69355 RepID=A0A7R9A480_9CRUS|nr:unnamed protein product [Darwinula stevensoni]CAG0893111.1 unnamed protein product [Darwinula stevensoni]